ncbi:MAG: hypothetical protein H6R07_629 [Proteobacteria bacterium]|nr:hypothetical protein [Pseudomonadota bacterium]
MVGNQQQSLIYLVTCDQQQAAELTAQMKLFDFSVRVFSRQSALLAAMHSLAPFALLVDESGLEDADFAQVAPLIARLTKGPLIYVSAQLSVVQQIEMMRMGITDFSVKPFDLQQLIDRLDHLLGRSQQKPFNVLIVDDSEAVSKWACNTLASAGMQAKVVHNPLDVLLTLERFKPDIILMDVYMPQCTGDEMARVVRQNAQYDSIPIVFLSTETSRGRQLMARGMGGDDFLVKNMDAEELVAAVSIIAERYRRLRHCMTRDSMTGLLNHTNMTDHLERVVHRARQEKTPVAFAMVDLDHFKQINDNFGHAVGDRVIKSLARLMRQSLNDADAVGRYGGEEFALVYDDITLIRAANLLDEMRVRFSMLDLQHGHGVFRATFSAGIARLEPGMSASQLIDAADEALYRAKRAGRNQVGVGLGQVGRTG